MKRKMLARLMAAVMVLTSVPANALVGYADEVIIEDYGEETIPENEPVETESPGTEPLTETSTEAPTEALTEAPTEASTEALTEAPTEALTEASSEVSTEVSSEASTEASSEAAGNVLDAAATDGFVDSVEVVEEFSGALDAEEYGDGGSIENTTGLELDCPSTTDSYFNNGDDVELEVEASVEPGHQIFYQWYKDNEVISGANSWYYDTYFSEKVCYTCVVSDENGYSLTVTFNLYEATLSLKKTDIWVDAVPEQPLTLTAPEATRQEGELKYEWYGITKDDERISLGETGKELTIQSVGEYQKYACSVSDANMTRTAFYYIQFQGGLSLTYEDTVYVLPDEKATLSVTAETNYGTPTYKWYISSQLDPFEETSNTYMTDSLSSTDPERKEHYYYRCVVSDDYSSETAEFTVIVDSGLEVEAASNTALYAAPGADVEMKVSASTKVENTTISYKWYDDEGEPIANATSDTYTVKAEKNESYTCEVSDGYQTEEVWFNVYINSGLQVQETEQNIAVGYNENVTLTVTASVKLGKCALPVV